MKSHDVLRALSRRHARDLWLTEVKTGPTLAAPAGQLHRIDGLALARSWSHPLVTGYEVKVSRQDWLRDDKWHAALDDCHAFYVACPRGLIPPEEVPADAGLIWVGDNGSISVRRKAPYRDVGLPALLLYYVALSRVDSDRHPYFSNTRQALEAWVADKEGRATLGFGVARALRDRLLDADERVRRSQDGAADARQDAERWQRAEAILHAAGISTWGEWEGRLRDALAGGAPTLLPTLERVARELDRVIADARRLEQAAGGGGAG